MKLLHRQQGCFSYYIINAPFNLLNCLFYFEQSNKASIIKSILGDDKFISPKALRIDDFSLKFVSFSNERILSKIDSPSGPSLI